MEAGLEAQGSFVALNNRVSQSVPHFHVHIVPRRRKDGLRGFFWPRQKYTDDTHARGNGSGAAGDRRFAASVTATPEARLRGGGPARGTRWGARQARPAARAPVRRRGRARGPAPCGHGAKARPASGGARDRRGPQVHDHGGGAAGRHRPQLLSGAAEGGGVAHTEPREGPSRIRTSRARAAWPRRSTAFRRTGCSSARIFGRAAAQAATASRVLSAEVFVQPGDTERDAALRVADAARTLLPQSVELLQRLLACTCASSCGTTLSQRPSSVPDASRVRGRSRCASRTWSTSRASARRLPSKSLARSPTRSPRLSRRWWSNRCRWSRPSVTLRCWCHRSLSAARCSADARREDAARGGRVAGAEGGGGDGRGAEPLRRLVRERSIWRAVSRPSRKRRAWSPPRSFAMQPAAVSPGRTRATGGSGVSARRLRSTAAAVSGRRGSGAVENASAVQPLGRILAE